MKSATPHLNDSMEDLMMIDTEGQRQADAQEEELSESDTGDDSVLDRPVLGIGTSELSTKKKGKKKRKRKKKDILVTDKWPVERMSVTADADLDEFEREMGWEKKRSERPKKSGGDVEKIVERVDPMKSLLAKSAIRSGFEQSETVARYTRSEKSLRATRRKEREKTKGKKWFHLPATEMTSEVRRDLEIVKMRSALDPKRFYKRNDAKALPKYFHIGKVVDSPIDYYNGRLTKKERKRTIVDELMADAEFAKFNKRKYREILAENHKQRRYKAHKHATKLKGKKK